MKSVRFYCRRFHVEEEVSHTHILTELIISLWSKELSLNFHHLLGIMTYRVIAQFYKRVSVYLRCGFFNSLWSGTCTNVETLRFWARYIDSLNYWLPMNYNSRTIIFWSQSSVYYYSSMAQVLKTDICELNFHSF
jgi:hypothetical protein